MLIGEEKANLADTAAANAINQQNVANAFGLTSSAQSLVARLKSIQACLIFNLLIILQQEKIML